MNGSCGSRHLLRPRSRRPRTRRAYVLVMVLALLVLSASLLVGVGHAAARRSSAALEARRDLQRRWGVVSCRMAVLPRVEEILTRQEALRRGPAASASANVMLGGQAFEIRMADEQAKANVNALLAVADVARVETQLRGALAGSGLINQIRLRPTQGPVIVPAPSTRPVAEVRPTATVSGFGQVFDGIDPVRLIRPMPGSKEALADVLTCWGPGSANVRRVGPMAMSLAAGRSITGAQITRLMDARNALVERAGASAGMMDDSSAVAAERLRNEVRGATTESLKSGGNLGLVERSNCHSVWVILRSGRRDEYHLAVLDRNNPLHPVVYAQAW